MFGVVCGLGGLPNGVALFGKCGGRIRVGVGRWSFVGQDYFIENKVECNAEQKVCQGDAHDNRPSRNRQRTCSEKGDLCFSFKY